MSSCNSATVCQVLNQYTYTLHSPWDTSSDYCRYS